MNSKVSWFRMQTESIQASLTLTSLPHSCLHSKFIVRLILSMGLIVGEKMSLYLDGHFETIRNKHFTFPVRKKNPDSHEILKYLEKSDFFWKKKKVYKQSSRYYINSINIIVKKIQVFAFFEKKTTNKTNCLLVV